VVQLTRLNGDIVVVNAAAIDLVEPTPDTRLTLASVRGVMVRESVAEVVAAVTAWYQAVGRPLAAAKSGLTDELGPAESAPVE